MGSDRLMGTVSWGDINVVDLERERWSHNIMNVNVTEVYMLKWLILCYVNFT